MRKYCEQTFQEHDISKTFEGLVACGEILRVALGSSVDHHCHKAIWTTANKYQNVVSDCYVASGTFVECALGALKCHRDAFEQFAHAKQADDLADGLDLLDGCAKSAGKMVEELQKLVDKLDDCMKSAEKAIEDTIQDKNDQAKLNDEIRDDMARKKAKVKGQQKELDLLEMDLAEAQEREGKITAKAEEARSQAHNMAMMGAIMSGVGGVINPLAKLAVTAACPMGPLAGLLAAPMLIAEQQQQAPTQQAPTQQGSTVSQNVNKTLDVKQQLNAAISAEAEAEAKLETAKGSGDKDKIEEAKREQETISKVAEQLRKTFDELRSAQEAHATTLEEQEAAASAARASLQKNRREQMRALEESVEDLAGKSEKKSEVEQALKALGITYQSMGVVKTSLLQSIRFWAFVKTRAELLSSMKDDYEKKGKIAGKKMERDDVPKGRQIIMSCCEDSASAWAGLGWLCLEAHKKIKEAAGTIDDTMTNLPTDQESLATIQNMARDLLPMVRQLGN